MSAKNDGTEELSFDEKALKIMKLTSDKERSMFNKMLTWWKAKNLRLSIQIEPEVGASLLTRLLLSTSTGKHVESTAAKITPKSPQEKLKLSTSSDAKRLSFVTPDEARPYDDDEASKVKRIVVVNKKSTSPLSPAKGEKAKPSKISDSLERSLDVKNSGPSEGIRNYQLASLVSLATDLAALLAANASTKETTPGSTPTVAYIASAYYFMFRGKDETKPTLIASEVVRTNLDENASDEEILGYSSLFQKALLGLSHAAKYSLESYSDFEYLWSSCTSNPSFLQAIRTVQDECDVDTNEVEQNENGKRPNDLSFTPEQRLQSAKEICWKLACLAHQQQKEQKNGPVLAGRRQRILTTAACLGLVSLLPKLSPCSTPDKMQVEETEESSQDEDIENNEDSSPVSKKPRSMKAVDALSTMVKGRSEETPAHQLVPPPLTDTMEVAIASMNNLVASLQPSFKNQAHATRQELENAVMDAAKLLASSGLIPSSKDPGNSTFDISSSDKDTGLDTELRVLLPSKAERARLVDAAAIDDALSTSVKSTVNNLNKSKEEVSLDGFPFVDESSLVSSESNVASFLCMASLKASSSGVALIGQYDESDIVSSQDNLAAAAIKSLVSDTTSTRTMRETMDLNEWTASILAISDVKPSTRLMLYLEASDDESVKRKRKRLDGVTEEITIGGGWRSVMAPLLNRVVGRLIDDTPSPHADVEVMCRVSVSDKDGSILVYGDEDDVEIKLCKALIALYYQSLEAIFYHETARLKSASHPKLIMSETFHRAALTCCCICLMKGLCSGSALALSEKFLDLDLTCIQQIMESCPYTYLKVSESFARALKLYKTSGPGLQSSHVLGLPRILQRELSQCEVLVIDSLLWSQEPSYSLDLSVMDTIVDIKNVPEKGAGPAWPPDVLQPTLPEEIDDAKNDKKKTILARTGPRPPDHLYLSYILRKLLKIAFFRISALCSELSIPPEYPVASQVWIAFRYLLRHNIELLYDRHVDQLILCTLYGVCKLMKVEPELTFAKTIEVYSIVRGAELGDRACHRLTRHIKLMTDIEAMDEMESSPAKKQYGNIIQFYNSVFVPVLKNHLLLSKSLKKAIAQLRECMADPNMKKNARRFSVQDSEVMASRADKLANDSGYWANEPTAVPVKEGNVQMNVLLPTATNTFDPEKAKKKQKTNGKVDSSSPENRTFFSFGEASTQNVNLINRMAAEA